MRATRTALPVLLFAALALGALTAPVAGQETPEAGAAQLRERVEARFRILPVSGGIVLTPRRGSGEGASIEIRDGGIAVDGRPTTGRELRERFGPDADLILQTSYLPADVVAAWGRPAPPPEPAPEEPAEPEPPAEPESPPSPPESGTSRTYKRSAAKVHIGGSVRVEEDEIVSDPVVAVGGSVEVLGRVEDDVVAVGGDVRLGPGSVVNGDATAVGGRVIKDPGAELRGKANEVRFGGGNFQFSPHWGFPDGGRMFTGWFRLFGTLFRLSLILILACVIMIIASGPVERIAERAGREPWLSGFVGLLFQILFVPLLVIVVVVLAISIIGIPLLLLVPFAIVAVIVGALLGFTAVAHRIGRWAIGPERHAFLALTVGLILVAAITIVARGLWLLPAPAGFLALAVAGLGLFVEYVTWTVGLGAVLLTRFGIAPSAPPLPPPPPPPPPAAYHAPDNVTLE